MTSCPQTRTAGAWVGFSRPRLLAALEQAFSLTAQTADGQASIGVRVRLVTRHHWRRLGYETAEPGLWHVSAAGPLVLALRFLTPGEMPR